MATVRSGGIEDMTNVFEQCENCCARNICPAGAMPGSIVCMMKKKQSGKTRGDEMKERRRCPHCGRFID